MCKNGKKQKYKNIPVVPHAKIVFSCISSLIQQLELSVLLNTPHVMFCNWSKGMSPYLNLVVLIYLLVEPRRRRKAHVLERDLTLWLPARTQEHTLTDKSENLITDINIFVSVTCCLCCTFHENYSLVFKCHSD